METNFMGQSAVVVKCILDRQGRHRDKDPKKCKLWYIPSNSFTLLWFFAGLEKQ